MDNFRLKANEEVHRNITSLIKTYLFIHFLFDQFGSRFRVNVGVKYKAWQGVCQPLTAKHALLRRFAAINLILSSNYQKRPV